MEIELNTSHEYRDWATVIANKIKYAHTRASLKVNEEMLQLYWEIGNSILIQQRSKGWGSKVIDYLATDILKEFPGIEGFSVRNLKYMRAFAEAYPQFPIVQVSLAQITWYHHISLISKVKSDRERAF